MNCSKHNYFFFQLFGFCVACYVIYVFTEEDDSCKLLIEFLKKWIEFPSLF